MSEENTKLTVRETLSLLGYGFGLVARMVPSYLPLVLVRSLLTAAQPLMVVFFSARILNELSGQQNVRNIVIYVSLAVGLTFIFSALKAVTTRYIEFYGNWERIIALMQLMEAEQYARMDFAHVEDGKLAETLARMDTHATGNGLGLMNMFFYPLSLSENLFSFIIAILLLTGLSGGGIVSGWGALVLLIVFAAGMVISLRYNAKEKTIMERIYTDNAKANTTAHFYYQYVQADSAAKDIRLYDQSEALIEIFKDSFRAQSWLTFFFFNGRHEGFVLAILAVVGGGFYMLMGYGALGGSVPVGSIVQTVGAVTALATAVGTLTNNLGKLWNEAPFLKPMREFLSLPDILVKGKRDVATANGDKAHLIEFRNVSFRYPSAEMFALKNLNLTLTPGERLAVVGLNGSGKTTMVKLLCRLYDPTEGEILLDGVNIKEYDYEQYIALFSVVFQDFALFPLWLGQNVAVSGDFDEKRVRDCLIGAGFAERLESMPDGLDTLLYKGYDEEGTEVSGGEAQKIALARALYRNAPVVVLDEPTAALDPIAEYEVYTTFDKTIGDKTAVFISHRLSSCRFCHRVAVFDGEQLIQLGTHDGLLTDTKGRYFELWEAQAGHYR